MDYEVFILLGFVIFIFVLFLSLWFAGVFTTKKGVTGGTGNNQYIKDSIAILMPPSVWSNPVVSSQCLIYNYPIVNGQFPYVTNNSDVVATLESTSNSRCYYSNELALSSTYQTCNGTECLDDLANSYSKGEQWTYYQQCGTSCYVNGSYLATIILAQGSSTFTQRAITPNSSDAIVMVNPNLEDSNQYHVILRCNSNSSTANDSAGHMCNIQHYTTGKYLTVATVPSYTDTSPTKPLWLMVPPTSLGGVAQSQKLVYIGDVPSGTIKANPTLLEYYNLTQTYKLQAIAYGTSVTMGPSLDADQSNFSYNSQIVDLSKYYTMLNGSTSAYPYYRWTQVGLNF